MRLWHLESAVVDSPFSRSGRNANPVSSRAAHPNLAARPSAWRETHRRFEGRTVRHDPRLDTPPQGHEQLARHGDNPDPASAAPAMPKALLIPLGQRTLRLQAPPAPGNLHRHRAAGGVAGCGDTLLRGGVATRIGSGRQAAQGADLLPIVTRPPAEKLHHEQPGTLAPTPFEPQELWHFLRDSLLRRLEHGTAFGFQRGHAWRSRHHVRPLLLETVAEARRKRGAVPQAEVLQLLGDVPAGGQHQAVRRTQALDAVADPRPIPFRSREGAVQLATVFFLPTGDPDDPPHLPFPRDVAQEHREQLLHSEPSGRGPPVSAIDCTAGRVDHTVGPPLGHEPTVEPEAVPARLVTADAWGVCGEPTALLSFAALFPELPQ